VTITATPAQGYVFKGWDISNATTAVLNVLMDANKTITAFFSKLFSLTVTATPQDAGTVKYGGTTYVQGDKATLTATSVFPYAFSSWTNTDSNSANPTTVIMDSDKNVTANFKQLQPGALQTATGQWVGNEVRVHFNLQAGQWVKGNYSSNRGIDVFVQDPTFATYVNLGYQSAIGFVFQAKTSGTYDFVMGGMSYVIMTYPYTVTYNIYS
jgi:uncharacterized repeat protein (TIGR02543 family)